MIPILSSLVFDRSIGDRLVLSVGLGMGGYVLYSSRTTTETQTYVQDVDPWAEGEKHKSVFREHLAVVASGGEASIAFSWRIGRSVLLGLTGRMIVISKIRDTWDYIGYYSTDWDPAESELITMKNGYEYGGIGWGLGGTVRF